MASRQPARDHRVSQSAIRDPASGEGSTPAGNLSSVFESRDARSINNGAKAASKAEDAEQTRMHAKRAETERASKRGLPDEQESEALREERRGMAVPAEEKAKGDAGEDFEMGADHALHL